MSDLTAGRTAPPSDDPLPTLPPSSSRGVVALVAALLLVAALGLLGSVLVTGA